MKTFRTRHLKLFVLTQLLIVVCYVLLSLGTALPSSWTKVNENGFGDPDNWGALLVKFKGDFYAFSDMGVYKTENGGAWTQVSEMIIMRVIVYKGALYGIVGNEVWQSRDGVDWAKVAEIPLPSVTDSQVWIDSLAVVGGRLYLGTYWKPFEGYVGPEINAELWMTGNGSSWTKLDDIPACTSIRNITGFKGMIYIGTISEAKDSGPHSSRTEIWRTSDGSTWQQVAGDGFGDILNTSSLSMVKFKGALYVSTWRGGTEGLPSTGTEVWRSKDGEEWRQVNEDGFGDTDNHMSWLHVMGGRLFAGTAKDGGLEVYQTSDGAAWQKIASDGFGDSANAHTASMQSFKGALYLATWSPHTGTQVWKH